MSKTNIHCRHAFYYRIAYPMSPSISKCMLDMQFTHGHAIWHPNMQYGLFNCMLDMQFEKFKLHVFSGGSPWTVTGPLFDLLDLFVQVLSCSPRSCLLAEFTNGLIELSPARLTVRTTNTIPAFNSTFVRLTLGGYNYGVMMRSSLGLT